MWLFRPRSTGDINQTMEPVEGYGRNACVTMKAIEGSTASEIPDPFGTPLLNNSEIYPVSAACDQLYTVAP